MTVFRTSWPTLIINKTRGSTNSSLYRGLSTTRVCPRVMWLLVKMKQTFHSILGPLGVRQSRAFEGLERRRRFYLICYPSLQPYAALRSRERRFPLLRSLSIACLVYLIYCKDSHSTLLLRPELQRRFLLLLVVDFLRFRSPVTRFNQRI